MYYLLLRDARSRPAFLERLGECGVNAVFHYVPLHSSPGGMKYGRSHGDLSHTQDVSDRLVRLPLWVGMTEETIGRVAEAVTTAVATVD